MRRWIAPHWRVTTPAQVVRRFVKTENMVLFLRQHTGSVVSWIQK